MRWRQNWWRLNSGRMLLLPLREWVREALRLRLEEKQTLVGVRNVALVNFAPADELRLTRSESPIVTINEHFNLWSVAECFPYSPSTYGVPQTRGMFTFDPRLKNLAMAHKRWVEWAGVVNWHFMGVDLRSRCKIATVIGLGSVGLADVSRVVCEWAFGRPRTLEVYREAKG